MHPMKTTSTNTPINEALFCAVDVETSGFRSNRLVEIGAIKFGLNGELEDLQTLVNPCEGISPSATKIHGITDDMVRNAGYACDVLPGLVNFMNGCAVVAHNAIFDVRAIDCELARAGCDPPENPVVCTLRLARRLIPGLESYRLESLAGRFDVHPGDLHNALPDARACMLIFLELIKKVPHETSIRNLPGFIGDMGSTAKTIARDIDLNGSIEEIPRIAEARLSIEIEYRQDYSSRPVTVTPLYCFSRGDRGYMKAYCHRDRMEKVYRLDRIVSLKRM
ncbi:MAG: WYL domain-containing protein [Actinobacteria bacterium]|nr:WYL domain-containing protein [Actinomycetota bacterium]